MSLVDRYILLPEWCTPKEAASFLGASPRRVYKMLDEGFFPHAWRSNPRGRWNIPKSDLAALLGMRVEEPGFEVCFDE